MNRAPCLCCRCRLTHCPVQCSDTVEEKLMCFQQRAVHVLSLTESSVLLRCPLDLVAVLSLKMCFRGSKVAVDPASDGHEAHVSQW